MFQFVGDFEVVGEGKRGGYYNISRLSHYAGPLNRRGWALSLFSQLFVFKGAQEGYAVWLDPKVTKN